MIVAVELEIVDLEEVRRRLREDPDFAGGLLTSDELAWCLAQSDPAPGTAARLAAKTATLRAFGIPPADRAWHEVEIVRDSSGRPTLRLGGRTAVIAREQAIRATHVSLTHARDQAAAAVVLEN